MIEPTALRETANGLVRAAGALTEQCFESAGDLANHQKELATLNAAVTICRRMARRIEAKRAQADDSAPFCLGCHQRKDKTGAGLDCALALDTKEACTKRRCGKYDPE